MKVVLVGTFGLEPKGTVSMRAVPLGIALANRGHDVTVIVPPWDNPRDSGKRLQIGSVEVVNIKLPLRIPLFWYLMLTYRMLQTIHSLQPDVIHCFKPKGFAGLVADSVWLVKKLSLSRTRLVMDTDDLEGKGGWNEIGSYNFFQRWFFSWQEKHGLRQADAVTTASASLTRFAQEVGVPKERVFYLPNGASSFQMDRFTSGELDVRLEYGLGTSPLILLYTRFFEFGIPRVVEIIAGIFSKVPDANLLVVGKGFFGEEQSFRELLEKQDMIRRVRFADWVQPEYLGSFFAATDVALYPMDNTSLNETKCPVKLIDLLFAGVPVVADRVGQTAEYIEDGASGFLVDSENPGIFIEKAVSLLKDETLRKRVGSSAKQRILAKFMWDELALTAEEAYSKI